MARYDTLRCPPVMTRGIELLPAAEQDFDQIVRYLSERDPDLGMRFFDATRETLAFLAKMPGMGSPYRTENTALKGLRRWRIRDFESYLVFYLTDDMTIQIVRILYGSQDIEKLFNNN